jgi:hypothetical protein
MNRTLPDSVGHGRTMNRQRIERVAKGEIEARPKRRRHPSATVPVMRCEPTVGSLLRGMEVEASLWWSSNGSQPLQIPSAEGALTAFRSPREAFSDCKSY